MEHNLQIVYFFNLESKIDNLSLALGIKKFLKLDTDPILPQVPQVGAIEFVENSPRVVFDNEDYVFIFTGVSCELRFKKFNRAIDVKYYTEGLYDILKSEKIFAKEVGLIDTYIQDDVDQNEVFSQHISNIELTSSKEIEFSWYNQMDNKAIGTLNIWKRLFKRQNNITVSVLDLNSRTITTDIKKEYINDFVEEYKEQIKQFHK